MLRRSQQPAAGDDGEELTRVVLEHAGVTEPTDLIGTFHDHPDRSHWAGLARPVCELATAGDAVASELAAAAAEHLAQLVLTVAELLQGQGLSVTLLDREPVLGAPLLASATQA